MSFPERKESNRWCVWDDGRWISLKEISFHFRHCHIPRFHLVIVVFESLAAVVVVEAVV